MSEEIYDGRHSTTPDAPKGFAMSSHPKHTNNPYLNPSLEKQSAYNQRMQAETVRNNAHERIAAINTLRKDVEKGYNIISLMDYVEKILTACGGGERANFTEVHRDMMQLAVKVPMHAHLHPGMDTKSPENPRFHKVVTQILLTIPEITGVRWIPVPEGAMLNISLDIPRGDKNNG